jgi:hypothetical protein
VRGVLFPLGFREQHAIFAACGAYQLTGCHARRAPRGEVRLYPAGHFDIYGAEPFERIVKDQLAFLARHVPVGTSPATR